MTTTKPRLCDECQLRTDGWVLKREKDLLTEEEYYYLLTEILRNDTTKHRLKLAKLKSLTKEAKS